MVALATSQRRSKCCWQDTAFERACTDRQSQVAADHCPQVRDQDLQQARAVSSWPGVCPMEPAAVYHVRLRTAAEATKSP